jgi:hypothetical protein
MRILFAVSSWPAHWYPMVPLGWALQSAGHEVRVLCAPSQEQAAKVAGLTPVPALHGMDMVFLSRLRYQWDAQAGNWPYPWLPLHPVTGEEMSSLDEFDFGRYVTENTADTFGALVRSFDATAKFTKAWRPELVIHDPVCTEGQLAAAIAKVPAVVHLWGPAGTHEPRENNLSLVPEYPPGTFAKWKVGDLSNKRVTHVIDPNPAELAPPIGFSERIPVRYVPYNGPGEAPTWLSTPPEKPRVCLVWGTSTTAMSGPRSFALPRMVEAVADLDAEVVLTATGADLERLGPLPDSVRVLERFPLRLLLPTCSAVVHHGGAGCLMTAMATGVPQVALTYAIEQQLNGERLAGAGAGAQLRGDLADPAAIRAAVTDLLDKPSYAQAAKRLADGIAARPSPHDLTERLVHLAGV